jgi:hypothetical protein
MLLAWKIHGNKHRYSGKLSNCVAILGGATAR